MALLKQAGQDIDVLQAGDASEGLALVDDHADLDAILLDLAMPGMDGLRAISEFGRKRPELPVIILSSSEDPRDARKAFALGAVGYVPKSASPHVLLLAIRTVLNGDLYVPPVVLGELPGGAKRQAGRAEQGAVRLTARQIEILAMLSMGQPNKTIAAALGISEKTVKAHITAIFRALNVVNRTQAAAVGREAGLI